MFPSEKEREVSVHEKIAFFFFFLNDVVYFIFLYLAAFMNTTALKLKVTVTSLMDTIKRHNEIHLHEICGSS